LQARFVGGIRRLDMADPRAEWAITTRRDARPRTADETGHAAG